MEYLYMGQYYNEIYKTIAAKNRKMSENVKYSIFLIDIFISADLTFWRKK